MHSQDKLAVFAIFYFLYYLLSRGGFFPYYRLSGLCGLCSSRSFSTFSDCIGELLFFQCLLRSWLFKPLLIVFRHSEAIVGQE